MRKNPDTTFPSEIRCEDRKLLRRFININITASTAINKLLPRRVREDGNRFFIERIIPTCASEGSLIYDLGGGSRPCISLERKKALGLTIVGLDISREELAAAPAGIYDRVIEADLTTFQGEGDGDVVICQSVMEHVRDSTGAIRAISSCLKPGGRAYIFAPCRNAIFARLNLILPQTVKTQLLFRFFPEKAKGHDGFPAHYDQCTPSEIEHIARLNGLHMERMELFWMSSYFTVFVPAFILWRLVQLLTYFFWGRIAAETFIYTFSKK